MPNLNRRRFLTLSAVALLPIPARAAQITQWHGVALGAEAAIYLEHPDAPAIIARTVAEIARLEAIFSLYRADSALSQLNATGRLDAPPFELLECLALCARVHTATGGLFDPTVQPLWQLYATSFAAGSAPTPKQIAATLPKVGLARITYDSAAIRLPTGAALTLNGIAQGFIADKVAELLAAEGLTDILINTGEFRALGQMPGGTGWPVKLVSGGEVALASRALATSSPTGTVFDTKGAVGHILNPATGLPAAATWTSVSISAPSSALADALSTAACLMPNLASVQTALEGFPKTRIEALV
ncbi:MAG: FAD:protein FMN transferase [Cypionkella sp.]